MSAFLIRRKNKKKQLEEVDQTPEVNTSMEKIIIVDEASYRNSPQSENAAEQKFSGFDYDPAADGYDYLNGITEIEKQIEFSKTCRIRVSIILIALIALCAISGFINHSEPLSSGIIWSKAVIDNDEPDVNTSNLVLLGISVLLMPFYLVILIQWKTSLKKIGPQYKILEMLIKSLKSKRILFQNREKLQDRINLIVDQNMKEIYKLFALHVIYFICVVTSTSVVKHYDLLSVVGCFAFLDLSGFPLSCAPFFILQFCIFTQEEQTMDAKKILQDGFEKYIELVAPLEKEMLDSQEFDDYEFVLNHTTPTKVAKPPKY